MQSISKTPLTHETMQTIVTHHFGASSRLVSAEELTDGYYNAAYRLDLADGLRCVLKVAPPAAVPVLRYEQDIMTAEVETIRLVRAHTTMPVPEILCHDPSHTLIGNEFFIMAFVAGMPFHKLRTSLSQEDQQRIMRQMGAFLAEMNAISGDAFGYFTPRSPRFETWRAAFDFMLRGVLADGQAVSVKLPLGYDALLDLVSRSYPALDEIQSPRLVHWDLWDGNVFVDPATAQITGIIDFERSLWGDPLMEVNFGAFAPLEPDSPLLQGYGRQMLATPAERVRRTLYNIYLFLIMIIECTYRRYPTQDQENWARRLLAVELDKLQA
jgi:aminoglycoside phosphotransferase (APT) family kinase protein